jgi:replicative DNA helicase
MAIEDVERLVLDAGNEMMIIAAAKSDTKLRKILVHKIAADEFLVPNNALIWRAIRRASDDSLIVTPQVMARLIADAGGDDKVIEYASEIAPEVPQNIDFHVDLMKWDATRARCIEGPIPEMIKAIKDPMAKSQDVLNIVKGMARALESTGRRFMTRPEETFRSYQAEIAARRLKKNVYPLGHEAFDQNLTEGFMPRRTTVSAGLPGAGKSTVWIAIAIMLAKIGRRPLYCGWEMDTESLLDVACAHMTGINLRDIVQGNLSEVEIERIRKAAKWIVSKIKFMGNPFIGKTSEVKGKPSNERNLDLLEGYLAESACDVVVYDLWDRMLPWRKPDDVTSALYRMQGIHNEYRIHGVIVHQLNLKDVEKRQDKRPTRDAIKGTGGYVEVADAIYGIHREAQFKTVPDTGVETICLKQRKGVANWSVRWKWNGATCYVGDPKEVPFDPGLEAVSEGDIGPSKISSPKNIATKPRTVRREQ